MAVKFLDNTGLGYFWGKIKAWCNSTFAAIAHTHTSYAVKHSYTIAANAAKNWYRIANANTSQIDTTKPIHAQFILTAYNTSYDAGYYERWFVNAEVFGKTASIVIFGNTNAPFSQARILYENTIADLDANDRPAIDIYLNYVFANGTTKIEIEEVYNQGWTFVSDGQISTSTIPTGFESVACDGIRNNGIYRSTYADWTSYTSLQRSNFTANFTLADNNTYRARVLNCTGTITVTVPSINSVNSWFIIKNFNTTSGVITIHPSTTSVLIDGSNANITLQPGEYIMIHSKAANAYTIVFDGRWKSQKADKGTTLSDYGITDAKITNGTITLGSNSITPLTSVPSHNQASNTINAMTGYSKPNSGSAIAVSDSLNDAIGKLEVKVDAVDDSNYVHLTGNETVVGTKTFSNIISGSIDGNAATASTVAWSGVTSKPTTIAGYGISDAEIANGTITLGSNSITPLISHQTLPTLSRTISGSGNAVTDITVSDHSITATKGATFADTNLSNLSSTGKAVIASLSIPSRKTSISVPANESKLTAPGDGAYSMEITSTNLNFCYLVLINETSGLRNSVAEINVNAARIHCFVPAKKGEKVQFMYATNSNNRVLYFVYNI